MNENNEFEFSKVIEEISNGPIFEITLKECFDAYTKNIALRKEMNEMNKRAQLHQAQIEQIKSYQQQSNVLEEKRVFLENELEEKNKRIKAMTEKFKKYTEHNERLEKKVNEMTKEGEKMEEEKVKIVEEYEKMLKLAEAEMEKYENRIDELVEKIRDVGHEHDDCVQLNDWLKVEINKADEQNKGKDEIIKKLKKENGGLKIRLKEKTSMPTTHSDIKKLIYFLKKFLPEINHEKLDQFLKTYESLHFCHVCKKLVPYTMDSRKKHAETYHGSKNDKSVYYQCFPGAREMCRCGQQYLNANQKNHVKTHHYDVNFECDEKDCNFNGILEEMEKHIKNTHSELDTADFAITKLVKYCFDLSISEKLARKTFLNQDRRPSNDDSSIFDMKLEEIVKLSNKNDSNTNIPDAREYNPFFEEGLNTPMKENHANVGSITVESSKKNESDKENKEINLAEEILDYMEFYADPEKNEDDDLDDPHSANWSKVGVEYDSISLQNSDNEEEKNEEEDLDDGEIRADSKNENNHDDPNKRRDLFKDQDLNTTKSPEPVSDASHSHPPSQSKVSRKIDFSSSVDGRDSRTSQKSNDNYRNSLSRLFDQRTPRANETKSRGYHDLDKVDKKYSSQRKRRYSSSEPEIENYQNPKSFRISVYQNGSRRVGNHAVENLREKNFYKKEPEFFTKQEIERFLEEADDDNIFCRYYPNGKCKYGPNCVLVHDKYEITKGLRDEIGRWQKYKISKVMDNVSSGDIQRAVKEVKDSAPHKMCKWYKQGGKCRFGAGCWDVHDEHEITAGLKKLINDKFY